MSDVPKPAFDSLAAIEATVARLERLYAHGRVTHPHLPWPPPYEAQESPPPTATEGRTDE